MSNRGKVPVPARDERLKIAQWAILVKEPVCRVERTMARFLPSRYKVLWALRVSRYKGCGEQVISQGTLSFKRTKAQSRYMVVGHVKRSRNKCKNRDKQMHFIVRISISCQH